MRWITRNSTAKAAAAVLATLAACGQAEDNRSAVTGDIRGVEELANPDLAQLNSADTTFNATTGALAVTLRNTETAVIVSMRASDSAILLNGYPVLSTTGTSEFATKTTVKSAAVNVAANNTTVIFDCYNGDLFTGTKPAGTASFGTGGVVVAFGAFTGGEFKVRGQNVADNIYVGQDSSSPVNVLLSWSGTYPDVEVTAHSGDMPSFGFSLGAGNDTFDATGGTGTPWATALGATASSLSFPVTVHGGVDNDTITGGLAADTIYGDEGLNTVFEQSGSATTHTPDTVYGLTTPSSKTQPTSTTVSYATWANATTGVKVDIIHVATSGQTAAATTFGANDFIDDSVSVVIGSPLADTMQCSQLTDVPCTLYGGPGNDTLSPGLSATNTEYLIGNDGNDTFAMNLIGSHVVLIGGNDTDVSTTVNDYIDTVDYSTAISGTQKLASTISMNGSAPLAAACTTTIIAASVAAGTFPRCPETADLTSSGLAGLAHTDIRNDIRAAKCPTGANSVGIVCTVKGNANGDYIYSGHGADLLTGGAGSDTFVIADFDATGTYTGAATKVITGNGGSDWVDFSARTSAVTVDLNCPVAASGCAISGNAGVFTGNTSGNNTATTGAATAAATATTAVATAYSAISGTPTANDTLEASDSVTAGADAATVASAVATFHTTANATNASAVTAAITTATTDNAALATQNALYVSGTDDSATNAAAVALHSDIATLLTDAAAEIASVGEAIELVAVSNAVCPANTGSALACAVTTGTGSSTIDFNNDGTASSLTCESSDVITLNATGLAANCGT